MEDQDKVKLILGVLLMALLLFYLTAYSPLAVPSGTSTTIQQTTTTLAIRTFKDNLGPIETKNGKPVIRMFSTTWCSHCKWVKDAYEETVMEYVNRSQIIAYHWEMDIDDDTLRDEKIPVPESEKEVFRKFNPGGGVPTFVFGSRFYRIGNGYEREKDLDAEKAEFRAVIEEVIRLAR
jgi:thiol-disulfide isomerase/thioredoxin